MGGKRDGWAVLTTDYLPGSRLLYMILFPPLLSDQSAEEIFSRNTTRSVMLFCCRRPRLRVLLLSLGVLLAVPALATTHRGKGGARLVIVCVLDGLRPDSINPNDTPHLYRLRRQGAQFVNGHAVFPTVTRVNAAALATGAYPGTNGIVGNAMYVPAVDPSRAFNTEELPALLTLDTRSGGRMVLVKSLGEVLQEHGLKFAAVSSGSPGSALLLNRRAPHGLGILVNGYLDPGVVVAYPPAVDAAILARFGAAPPKGGFTDSFNAVVDWTQEVLTEYVIPELQPDVVFNWFTEPDHIQHVYGVGSPEALNALRNADRHVGLLLQKLAALGLADGTDLFVVSDHGFSVQTSAVNVTQALMDAGLKTALDSDDVVVASSGQSVLLHVKARQPRRITEIVRFLQTQDWTGVLFTAARRPDLRRKAQPRGRCPEITRPSDEYGWVPGTFSLELIHVCNPERGPDIVLTFPWTSGTNAFGVAGTDTTETSGATGLQIGAVSGHGGLSPWTVHDTFIA
ncbi:MAG TPA: alkaline phosphatase family protein, partial [Candidatus Binatia bacterium]|nr:alkaline phosphatase family protein [Candidatus Binatia bacterium]